MHTQDTFEAQMQSEDRRHKDEPGIVLMKSLLVVVVTAIMAVAIVYEQSDDERETQRAEQAQIAANRVDVSRVAEQ